MSTMPLQLQTFQGASLHGLKGLIARSPPSRLLNLNALRRSPPEDPGYLERPFFLQPILNRAIIVKHNMRRGEESLDGKRQLNALKILFPLDASNLTFGARTVFASQYDLESIFRICFESAPPSTDRDLKLIGLLEEAPTLDRKSYSPREFVIEKESDQKISECFSSWKVVLFYRLRLAELTSATKHLLISLERLRPSVGQRQTTPLTEQCRTRIRDALWLAISEAQGIVEDYNLLHHSVLRTGRPELFRALLRQSKDYLTALGARIGRLDDALGFWSAHAPGGPDGVETYRLESFMVALDRHIGTDLMLPGFVRMSPRLGLIDDPSPWAAPPRLRSDPQG